MNQPPLPGVMVNPSLLPQGDHWNWGCPECHTAIQGGRVGLALHINVVHRPTPTGGTR